MEDALGHVEQVCGSVELGDGPRVHDADPVIANDGAQTIWNALLSEKRRRLSKRKYARAIQRIVRSLNSVAIVSWIFLSVS